MAELTLRMASNLIGYTFAEYTFPAADDLTPEQVARLQWEWNLRFLAEQEKIANEPVTEEQEAAITAAAVEVVKELKAEVQEEISNGSSAHSYEDGAASAPAPWDDPPPAPKKVWEEKPKFDLF